MKVIIRPYADFWGAYKIADLLRYIGVSEELREKVGAFLQRLGVDELAERVKAWRDSRRVFVKIHKYDTCNADSTIAEIMVPLLKAFRVAAKTSTPAIRLADVPLDQRSTAAELENLIAHDDPDFVFDTKAWQWILGEILWAFESRLEDDEDVFFYAEDEDFAARASRREAGMRLFATYYENLWT